MKLSRPSRVIAAFIALISILFTQLAVAGYACPDLTTESTSELVAISAQVDHQNMPDCIGLDAELPSLCHAHAQIGDQSLDKPPLPPVQPFVAAALASVFQQIEFARRPPALPSNAFILTRITAPPAAIRNCCFRI